MDLSGTIKQLVEERDRLNAAIAALQSINGASSVRASGKRTLSASARARIAAAQRKRWAKFRGNKH